MMPDLAYIAAALALLVPPLVLVLRNRAKEPALVARAQFVLKVMLFAVSLAASSLVGILAAPFLYLAGRRNDTCRVVGRTFRVLCALFAGVSVRLQLPHHMATRPAIFVANHQSTLDVLVMGTVFPRDCTVIAKTSLKRVPLVGQFLCLANAVWIDRKNTASAKEAMARAVDKIKASKMSCFVYPEGTRSHLKNAQLLPFKKGAFHLAVQAQIAVVPVVFASYEGVYDSSTKFFPGGTITVRALEPIPTKGMTADDVDELTELVYQRMLAALKEISARPAREAADVEVERNGSGAVNAQNGTKAE